jgi:hypothetical protein
MRSELSQNICPQLYAHEHGVSMYESVTYNAAAYGQLHCLIYAHKHGAPFHPLTCMVAAEFGSLPCLRYAITHGAPLLYTRYPCALTPRNRDCYRYLDMHVSGWPDCPAEIIEWRVRVRATAATILRIVRFNRAKRAATTIQRFWKDRHYTPGGRGAVLAIGRLNAF